MIHAVLSLFAFLFHPPSAAAHLVFFLPILAASLLALRVNQRFYAWKKVRPSSNQRSQTERTHFPSFIQIYTIAQIQEENEHKSQHSMALRCDEISNFSARISFVVAFFDMQTTRCGNTKEQFLADVFNSLWYGESCLLVCQGFRIAKLLLSISLDQMDHKRIVYHELLYGSVGLQCVVVMGDFDV